MSPQTIMFYVATLVVGKYTTGCTCTLATLALRVTPCHPVQVASCTWPDACPYVALIYGVGPICRNNGLGLVHCTQAARPAESPDNPRTFFIICGPLTLVLAGIMIIFRRSLVGALGLRLDRTARRYLAVKLGKSFHDDRKDAACAGADAGFSGSKYVARGKRTFAMACADMRILSGPDNPHQFRTTRYGCVDYFVVAPGDPRFTDRIRLALETVSREFKLTHGRTPTFWVTNTIQMSSCIDLLPVFAAGCSRSVCSPSARESVPSPPLHRPV